MRVLRRPNPVGPLLAVVLAVLGIVAVVVLGAGVAAGSPGFGVLFFVAWSWNAYWWAWRSPATIEIHDDGALRFRSVIGRTELVALADIRSLKMSPLMIPMLRYEGGWVALLPNAPVVELAGYLHEARPDLEVTVPGWTKP